MEAWEVEEAVADHYSRVWEEMNEEPEEPMEAQDVQYDGASMRLAERALRLAISDMDTALDCINEATVALVNTPEGDRLTSILNDLEGYLKELKEKQTDYEGRAN